jgi:anti-sigma regulatory factor (Ser/Thr protein kinase)
VRPEELGGSAGPATTALASGRVYPIREWSDVAIARHQGRRLARDAGFEASRAGAVAIVVSELASNIVKYGVRGEIEILVEPAGADGGGADRGLADRAGRDRGLADRGGAGPRQAGMAARDVAAITVIARDVGPPIHDLPTAMRDGHDDRGPIDAAALAQRGGLGTGLGAVARLADRLEVRQEEGRKQITATFTRRPARVA